MFLTTGSQCASSFLFCLSTFTWASVMTGYPDSGLRKSLKGSLLQNVNVHYFLGLYWITCHLHTLSFDEFDSQIMELNWWNFWSRSSLSWTVIHLFLVKTHYRLIIDPILSIKLKLNHTGNQLLKFPKVFLLYRKMKMKRFMRLFKEQCCNLTFVKCAGFSTLSFLSVWRKQWVPVYHYFALNYKPNNLFRAF